MLLFREMMGADEDSRNLILKYQKGLSKLKKSAEQVIHKKKLMINSALNDSVHNSSGLEDDSNDEDDKLLEGVQIEVIHPFQAFSIKHDLDKISKQKF